MIKIRNNQIYPQHVGFETDCRRLKAGVERVLKAGKVRYVPHVLSFHQIINTLKEMEVKICASCVIIPQNHKYLFNNNPTDSKILTLRSEPETLVVTQLQENSLKLLFVPFVENLCLPSQTNILFCDDIYYDLESCQTRRLCFVCIPKCLAL